MIGEFEFISYIHLTTVLKYGSAKHNNLRKALKYGSGNNTCLFTDWRPYKTIKRPEMCGVEDDFLCKDGKKCDILKKCFVYHLCKNTENQEHYHCSCGEAIFTAKFFRNINNGNELIIGSKCYYKFGPKAKEIMDEYEGKMKCFHCSETVSKPIIQRQQGCEKIYKIKCLNKLFKKCKKCKEYKKHNCKCDNINTIEPEPPAYETITPPSPPETSINLETIVKFGKYRGKQISELIKDLNYCKWIKCEDDTHGQFRQIQEYLLNNT